MFLYGFIWNLISYRELIGNIWALLCLTVWLSSLFLVPHPTPHGPSAWQEPLLVDLFFTATLLPLVSLKGLFSALLFLVSFHVSCDRLYLPSLIWGRSEVWQDSNFIFIILYFYYIKQVPGLYLARLIY